MRGKREERFASLCRIDQSSLKRHKARWHNTEETCCCTVVPSTAAEVKALRNRYTKSSALGKGTLSSTPSVPPAVTTVTAASSTSVNKPERPVCEVQDPKESIPVAKSPSSNQTTMLSYSAGFTEANSSPKEVTLTTVIEAISSLSLKVDNFGKHHATLEQLVFEDDDVRKGVLAMKEAKNILQLAEVSEFLQFFYDEESETAVLRCLPCFKMHLAARPALTDLSPFQAQRIINTSSNGRLATGILLNKETTRLLIEGQNQTWYRQKKNCIDHLCLIGDGSKVHQSAMKAYQRKLEMTKRKTTATSNIFRAAIVDLKLGAAARHFETLISFLACCSVDIGDIGHSRNNFNDILYCLEKTVNRRINVWLNKPLPSTQLPPHIWATVDKGTPSRTTNQAFPVTWDAAHVLNLGVAGVKDSKSPSGIFFQRFLKRCNVFNTILANGKGFAFLQLIDESARRPVAFAGQRFASSSYEQWLKIENLGVAGVKDSKSPSGIFFQRFLKRCNVFNTILANGKGFAFLQLIDESARRPVAFAGQRFASSSYEQWLKIETSYGSFWKAFDMLHPNRDEDKELQYMIAGSDFVADLLACLDILKPIVDLMLRVQSLDTPVWKLKLWWPKIKLKLAGAASGDEVYFPRLRQTEDVIKPGGVFKGVELLEGWLVIKDEGKGASGSRFTWKMREESEIREDHKRLASDLLTALDRRVNSVVSDHSLSVLQVFDAAALVSLHCGSSSDGVVKLAVPEGEYESYGVEACEAVLKVASKLKHIQKSGMDFDPQLAFRYMTRLKKAVKAGIWNGLCPDWFILTDKDTPMKSQDVQLISFEPAPSDTLETFFTMKFANGQQHSVRLHEQNVYSSFYSREDIYDIAKPPSCAILDFVLAKGGPEAIAESYYSAMRAQQQSGGQSNDTLTRRTKLNWCLPSLKKCDDILRESVGLCLKGDDNIRPHRQRAFFARHEKRYSVSKVVDRVNSDLGRCPFLAD